MQPGDVTSIIGASGSGKSTLLRCINLLETLLPGRYCFTGRIYRKKALRSPPTEPSRYGIQNFNLLVNLSVLENCIVGQRSVLGRSREEAEVVKKYLTRLVWHPI